MGGDARALLSEAQKQFEGGDYARSESLALKALQADPKLAGAELLLGIVASARSRIEDAVTHFSRAAQMDPRDYHAFGYLGTIYVRQKRFNDAEIAFRKVLDLQRSNAAAHYNLGLLALMRGNPGGAVPQFQSVLEREPSDAAALSGALESELLLNRREEARKYAGELERVMDPR